ncbi:nitrile hydratase subunit beta [Pseudonocardia sp. H11422]|uniref:nitrile hydratase subunit beta n=1 Tax=Pseudonocardia sp. H11422 TaxID=2835866 RepID=UPI001BDC2EC3|nr:nitrile hydratase subunit beta [Pseudonocardia sp. H11422]
MNGAQDLGGVMGFGAVVPEPEDVRFHAGWEKRALALTLAAGATGAWSIDASRHARESLHPADYLCSSYYEIWTKGLERLLVSHGLVSGEELAAGRSLEPGRPVERVLSAAGTPAALAAGTPYDRPAQAPARFAVGERVRTGNRHPAGHTRLPRYARDKNGVIEQVRGVFVFPDTNAHGDGEAPQWLYTVRFSGHELWGPDADPTLTVSVDAWESYLDAA